MDVDLDFCLKRFADEQVTDTMKQIGQLERNLERKRRNITETLQHDDEVICQQENTFVKQFLDDLNENNMTINRIRQVIEIEFRKTLHDIKADIEIIAQISTTTRNNNHETNEEIRSASSKIRQQIARIDSELTHLFNIIDYDNSTDYISRIIQRFQQHYGYANELNRMVGKNNNTFSDLLVFSQTSPLMQSIIERVHLWNSRRKLITTFIHDMDEDSITSQHLMDAIYRMTDTSSSFKFIQCYMNNRQEGRRHREERLIHEMEDELEKQRMEQQIRVIELVNTLSQLSINTTNEFQLNKKFKKILQQTEVAKEIVPILIEHSGGEAADLFLMIRLEANCDKWASNDNSIQQRFCLALCDIMQLPSDALKIERIEEGSAVLYILIHPSYDQRVIEQISDRELSLSIVQSIQNCCAKFGSRVYSIVSGQYALTIEKRLMDLKWPKMLMNNGETINTTCSLYAFDRSENRSVCPEGWKRFGINVANNDDDFDAKWGSWHVAYHGSHGMYAPYILTSGLRVLTQYYCMPEFQQDICLSPSIEYSAHPRHTRLWKRVANDNGEKYQYYQLVFQCRVNPAVVRDPTPETLLFESHKSTRIDEDFHNENLEWIIEANTATQEYVRNNIVCYGLMVRVINNEPKDLPILNWWKDSYCVQY